MYKDFCVVLATNKMYAGQFYQLSESIDMMQKMFAFVQLSGYVCTRSIQFPLQIFQNF